MIILLINSSIIISLIVLILVTSQYQKEEIQKLVNNSEGNPKGLIHLYPSSMFILHQICRLSIGKKCYEKVYESMQCIHVREDPKERTMLHICKLLSAIIVLIFCINSISILSILSKTSLIQDSYYIKRPYYGEDETTVSVDVGINERKRNVQVELHERHYTQEDEINQVMEKAKVYLDKVVLGDNVSYEHVTEPLYLIAKIPDLQVDVSWGLDQKGVVSNSGKITISEEEVEGILVTMTATLDYYDTKILYPINMVVFPKEKTKEEKLLKQLEEAVHNSQVEDPESEYLKLPEVIENQSLTYSDNNSKDRNILILLGAIAVICIGVGGYTQLEKEKKKRNRQMLLDYPDIINKLVLLVGAGMTTKNAWGKMCLDYENKFEINKTSNNKRYVYEEMVATYNEIQNGVTEIEAFDRFGRRVQLVPYMKLSSLLVQNMKRGTADLLQLLEYEAVQAFEERKEVAKRLGEEAGTKLLGPMVLMLFIVLIIIMVPAFMQM